MINTINLIKSIRKKKKGALSLEMVAVYILALAFMLVVIYLIMRNNSKLKDLIRMFSGI